jgi:spore coat protein A
MMKVLLNNRQFMNMDGTISTPTETPRLRSTEVWQFINMTPDTHPMHMHLVTFEVIGRQKLVVADANADGYLQYAYGVAGNGAPITTTGAIPPQYLSGPVMPPAPNETGRKDTVKTNPGEVTYVIAKFEHFTGKFVYHCHILDHEENDMMQYMKVVGPLGKESADDEFTEHSIMPSDYALEQNFPNPFNPETQIRFQIPDASHVSIRVFNTAGQEVATLIDTDLQAGWHTANWNAANLSSGAYFYRLEAGTFSTVKKMLLLK